jgi:hypothetical protein
VTDGIVRANLFALAALDALVLIDDRLAVLEMDGAPGADFLAGMCHTAHAGIGNLIPVLGACVAGGRDDLHQRGLVIFLCNITLLQTFRQMSGTLTVLRPQAHTHGQTDPLPYDSSVTVDGFPEFGLFVIYHLVGKSLHIILEIF